MAPAHTLPPAAAGAPGRPAANASLRRQLKRLRFLATRNLAPLLGDTWAGLDMLCAAAGLDPSDQELWGGIATLAARLGDLARARAATEKGLALSPRAVPLRERLVLLLGAGGDWGGAAGAILALRQVDATHPWW